MFYVQFLLIDINHNTIFILRQSNFMLIGSCFQSCQQIFLKKAIENRLNDIYTFKKEKNKKEHLLEQLDVPKKSCFENSKETITS